MGVGCGAHLEVQDLVRTFSDTKEQCNYVHIDLAVVLRQTPEVPWAITCFISVA
jgi:hypothetical protein